MAAAVVVPSQIEKLWGEITSGTSHLQLYAPVTVKITARAQGIVHVYDRVYAVLILSSKPLESSFLWCLYMLLRYTHTIGLV